jgi:hypothetical protein
MSTLPISNIVNVSISAPQTGLGAYEVNNVAIISKDAPTSGWTGTSAGYGVYLTSAQVAADWGSSSETYYQAVNLLAQLPNLISGGGQLIIYAASSGQTLTQALTALQALIFFGGAVYAGYNPTNSEVEAAATYMQGQGLLLGVSSCLTTDLSAGGLFYVIRNAGQNYVTCFLYTIGTDGVSAGSAQAARIANAAYVGRLMSTNFNGTNTTSTMQLKGLTNVLPDPGITQTVLTTCESLGVDVYASIGGLAKVISNGGSSGAFFADNAYNLIWLTFALEVALFNVLATTSTKIPQTESGMAQLKAACSGVLAQAVTNGYLAPGTWTSPSNVFGDPATFNRVISQQGYYVYSQPISKQSAAARTGRTGPLIQIAGKLAGGINNELGLIFINP